MLRSETLKTSSCQVRIIHLLLALLLLTGATASPAQVAASSPGSRPAPKVVQGRVIIKLVRDQALAAEVQSATDSTIDRLLAHSEITSARPLFTGPFSDPKLANEIGLERFFLLELKEGLDLFSFIDALAANPAIASAEPDYILTAAVTPDDGVFNLQWGMDNTGQLILGYAGISDADIDLPEAWDITTGSSDILIAIVDTGVDLTHPDLAAKLVDGYNIIDDNPNAQDDDGHGTHVAGIAAAATDNDGTGVAGVCWECKIMPIKVLGADGGSTSDVADGIRYAADHGAHLINLSLGGSSGTEALEAAVRYAYLKNIPILAAMGNYGSDEPFYPAAYPETIAVGATDKFDLRWDDSNYGDNIDLVAPGSEILSTYYLNQYAYMWGTSMSTPHVAGVLGLLRSMDPDKSIEVLRTILRASSDDLGPPGWDIYYGAGRLNAYQALRSLADGLGLSPSNQEGFGLPGQVVEHTLTLINTGDFADTFNMELSEGSLGWEANLSVTSLSLAEGETALVTVQVTIPAEAQTGDSDSINLTAATETTPSVTASATLTTSHSEVGEHAVSLLPADQVGYGLPGKVIQYNLSLTNTGNVPDTYDLALSAIAERWDAELPDASFALPAGESAQATVLVTIPDDALESESYAISVKVTSQTDDTITNSVTLTTVTIYSRIFMPAIMQ